MRLLRSFNAFAAAGLASLASGAASAQALERVGVPVPAGTGFQPAVTESARYLQWLDHMLLIICVVIVVFVCLLLGWIAIRYNSRRNPKPATFSHNTPLEVAWTLVPILVLVFIGSFSLPILFKSQEIPQADITIKATGNQWYWSYDYVDDGVTFDSFMLTREELASHGYTDDEYLLATDTAMVIPVGKIIVVQTTGADVIHGWQVPAFGVQHAAVPGRLGDLWFAAEREGIYFGQCNALCGKDHSYMPIVVKVVSEAAYAKWLEAAKAGDVVLAQN